MLPQFLPGGRKIVIKRKLIAMERLASITNMTIHRKAMVVQQELVMVPMERQNMAITIVAMIIKISIARIFVQGFQKMLRLLPGFKVPQAQNSFVKRSELLLSVPASLEAQVSAVQASVGLVSMAALLSE